MVFSLPVCVLEPYILSCLMTLLQMHLSMHCVHSSLYADMLRCDQGTNFVGAKGEFMKAMKDLDHDQIKEHGCEFIMNFPSSSHVGGVWERQIRTIRSVLTEILDQSAKRLDCTSLRTFFYEVMALVLYYK